MQIVSNPYQKNSFGQYLTSKNSAEKVRINYIYGMNTQERVDEISGEGNHYTAEFWEYDTRTARRWNVDPVLKVWESPYLCFSGNPVLYSDPKGDDIIGLSKRSANRTKDIIKNSFSKDSQKAFRNLIKTGGDGKTFQHIKQDDFDNATKSFSDDEKALAKGYFDAINDGNKHRVGVLNRNEKIGEYIPTFNLDLGTGALTKNNTGADIDEGTGGGFNYPINKNEDLTIIIADSKVPIGDNKSTKTGKYQTPYSSSGELLAHEMLGHGLTRYNGVNNTYTQWVNAIRLTNLYLRNMGVNDRYRDGSQHGGHNFEAGNKKQVTAVPDYLK